MEITWSSTLPTSNRSDVFKARAAGDFAGRCFGLCFPVLVLITLEILSKRPFRDDFGEMTIDEVNTLLDRLSAVSKEYISVCVPQLMLVEKISCQFFLSSTDL